MRSQLSVSLSNRIVLFYSSLCWLFHDQEQWLLQVISLKLMSQIDENVKVEFFLNITEFSMEFSVTWKYNSSLNRVQLYTTQNIH